MGAQVHKRCLGIIGEKKDETVVPPLQAKWSPRFRKRVPALRSTQTKRLPLCLALIICAIPVDKTSEVRAAGWSVCRRSYESSSNAHQRDQGCFPARRQVRTC